MACTVFKVPMASVYLPATQRRWVGYADGVDPAAWASSRLIEGGAELGQSPLWIADLQKYDKTPAWPCVQALPDLRFFAIAPFEAAEQGYLSLFDTQVHPQSPESLHQLKCITAIAQQWLELWTSTQEALVRAADFRLLAESSSDTIIRGDLEGVRLYISPSVKRLLGYEPEELIGRRAIELTHPEDVPACSAVMQAVREGRLDVGVIEQRQRHKDGRWVWLEATIRLTHNPHTGIADGYVASVRGVEQRKALEARLTYLASYDDLTGLPNQSLFNQQLMEALAQAQGGGQRFALLYMDLDDFKSINDQLGQAAGDALLCEAAARFRTVLRPDDCIARFEGDVFAAILEASRSEAALLAERLIAAVAQPFRSASVEVTLGLSIGIACIPAQGLRDEDLIQAAQQALRLAKQAGKNTFRFFIPYS